MPARYGAQSNAGVSDCSLRASAGWKSFLESRCSTCVIEPLASAVSIDITVSACALASPALSPINWNMRATCTTYFSRSSFDLASVLT